MTDKERFKWLRDTAQDLASCFIAKFDRGRMEHGCDLASVRIVDLFEEMEHEALDQLAYIREIKRRYEFQTWKDQHEPHITKSRE